MIIIIAGLYLTTRFLGKEEGKERQVGHMSHCGADADDEWDDDFLPAIPEALLHSARDDAIAPTPASDNTGAEQRKRQRSLSRGDKDDDDGGKDEENLVEVLNAEGFPTPSLFERSYRHDPDLHDIGVLQDELGALIVTIDANGTLRAWRKLPRGVFFMGEHQGMFPASPVQKDPNGTVGHFILTDPLMSSLFAVRVTSNVEAQDSLVTVVAEVRQVNPVLITVEGRFSFQFIAALRCGADPAHWKASVTPRPFLLHHDYQPYLVFFAAERGEVSSVVLAPCVAERASRSFGGEALFLPSTPLSTANLVVCCQQHRPSGCVVLVDEKGIIDYARVVSRPGKEGQTIVSLQVVPGAPSRGAADPMLLRKWITFDRRQKTGFFTLLRETATFAQTGREMIPLCVRFSPSGKYFVVATVFLREGHLCLCSHVFEFSSGAFLCRGETEETTASRLCDADAVQQTRWRMRGAVFNVVVEETVRKPPQGGAGGVWVFIPEIVDDVSLDGRVCGRRIFVFCALPSLLSPMSVTAATTTTAAGKDLKPNTTARALFRMERVCPSIGDVEKNIRATAPSPPSRTAASDHFAAPLALLRLAVPASQALKNIVAQSPVGAAISQEDVKRLFLFPGNAAPKTPGDKRNFDHSDPTFCTASLGASALLLYTKYEPDVGGSDALTHKNAVAANETDVDSSKANEALREKMILELQQKRDFYCGDLLQLQMSTRHVVPREAMETEEKTEEGKFGDEAMTLAKMDSSEAETGVEERRVQNIINAAAGTAAHWEMRVIYASLFVDHFGPITVRLLPQFAPKAVENFVALSRERFYEGLTFHRVVPGFMIQGGCPLGDGTGGKSIFGGTFEDEGMDVMDFFLYPSVYWLCMANRGPNTNESQFFITVGEAAPWLQGKHTVLGFVVSGKPVVQAIAHTKTLGDDRPVTPVVIQRVVIVEREETRLA